MKIFGYSILMFITLAVVASIFRFGCNAAEVVQKEFSPQEMLRKYEWFKDASAQLDKKKADIKVYENRLKVMENTYENIMRIDWPKEDRQQYNLWTTEIAGVRASYNMLAADYNSQMAKFNWRFANAGQLPQGATEVLPREYKPYEE